MEIIQKAHSWNYRINRAARLGKEVGEVFDCEVSDCGAFNSIQRLPRTLKTSLLATLLYHKLVRSICLYLENSAFGNSLMRFTYITS